MIRSNKVLKRMGMYKSPSEELDELKRQEAITLELAENKLKSIDIKEIKEDTKVIEVVIKPKISKIPSTYPIDLIWFYRAAKQRGKPIELNEQDIRELITKPCEYCGSLPSTVWGESKRNGIDRIDSGVGYKSKQRILL